MAAGMRYTGGMERKEREMVVTVYRLRLEEIERSEKELYERVSEEDRASCDRFKLRADFLRRLGSAYLIRKYVGEGVKRDEWGKPKKEGVYFNVSHSGEYVVLALAPAEIGVDVEKREGKNADIFSAIATEEERGEDFYFVWTQKESLLKCVGSGIVVDLKSVPALPVGQKTYKNERYYSYATTFSDYVLSVTVRTDRTDVQVRLLDDSVAPSITQIP